MYNMIHLHMQVYIILNNSMEQSPSREATSGLASQETSRILWNPTIYFRVQSSQPLHHILGPDSHCFLHNRFNKHDPPIYAHGIATRLQAG